MRSVAVFLAIVLFSVALFPCFVVCCLLFGSIRAFRWIARFWGRGVLRIAGIEVDIEGLDHLPKDQSCIVVANHGSQIDIVIIAGFVPLDLKWVVKRELAKHPIIGPCSWLMGNVFVDRRNSARALASLNKIQSVIRGGICLLFFPEGTRSKIARMLPFKSGAFMMAKQLQLPILPISIVNASHLMPSGQLSPNTGRVKLVLHQLLDANDVANSDAKDLSQRVRTIIQTEVEPHLLSDS